MKRLNDYIKEVDRLVGLHGSKLCRTISSKWITQLKKVHIHVHVHLRARARALVADLVHDDGACTYT